MDDPWRDVAESGHWLLDLEEQYAPDVVHLNRYGHGALPWQRAGRGDGAFLRALLVAGGAKACAAPA